MSFNRDDPQLFVRRGNRVVAAPADDIALAATYGQWPDKGPESNGRRLTILTWDRPYLVGEAVRIVHVVEVGDGQSLYVVGPKAVQGEYVDSNLVTPQPLAGADPLTPLSYDGHVLPGPGIDFNWEITEYEFTEPGAHRIIWRPGELTSNELTVQVLS